MTDPDAAAEIGRLPVHEEVLRIARRRRVTGTLRVAVTTAEAGETVEATRRHRRADVARVPVGREVEAPPPVRQEGDTLVIPVLEERLVLVRRLVLTEELRIRLHTEEEAVQLEAPRRRQRVEVARLPAPPPHIPGEIISMNRTITALFDSRAEADRAAEALLGLGIGASDIQVHASGAEGSGGAAGAGQDRGFLGSLANLFVPDDDRAAYGEGLRRGGFLLSAQVEEQHLDHAIDALEAAGAVDLDQREATWRQEGWSGGSMAGATAGASSDGERTGVAAMPGQGAANPPDTMASRGIDEAAGTNLSGAHPENEAARGGTAAGMAAGRTARGREEAIPIAEENLRIGKREARAGRVRVRSHVMETPVAEQVRLREQHVRVERHAVDRPATGSEAELFRERTIEAEESIEEPVVQKEVRVTGEVVVSKEETERTETIRDTVRRTEVEVDENDVANDPTRRGSKGAA